jgi:hypothetical protein
MPYGRAFSTTKQDERKKMSDENPLQPVSDGKDLVTGRFAAGNQCAKGNAVPRKAATFRAKLFRCVTPADFRAIVQKLVEEAKAGEPWAMKLALQYLVGRSEDVEMHERLLILETTLTERM